MWVKYIFELNYLKKTYFGLGVVLIHSLKMISRIYKDLQTTVVLVIFCFKFTLYSEYSSVDRENSALRLNSSPCFLLLLEWVNGNIQISSTGKPTIVPYTSNVTTSSNGRNIKFQELIIFFFSAWHCIRAAEHPRV